LGLSIKIKILTFNSPNGYNSSYINIKENKKG